MNRLGIPGLLILALACKSDDDDTGDAVILPDVDAATFVQGVDHPLFPLPPGATWAYEVQTEDGLERIEVEVLDETREVNGVEATVVRDTETLDGALTEDTRDWFAQDEEGNVWYLGEETCEYQDGKCVDTGGSWEWGVDGALPGIIMPADPAVDGREVYQEYYPGEAEDVGEVVAVGTSASVPAGAFVGCVRIHETSTLELDLDEEKTYCPGVGLVLIQEEDARVELVEYGGL